RLSLSGVENVSLLPPMSRDRLLDEYRAADVLFLHLNDYEAFKKVLPSKVFEYAATGKPIWAGVGGFAAQFLREHVDNVAVFAPCDAAGAVRSLASLELTTQPRTAFLSRFARRSIMSAMAADIVATARRRLGMTDDGG